MLTSKVLEFRNLLYFLWGLPLKNIYVLIFNWDFNAITCRQRMFDSKKFLVGRYTDTSWMAQNRLHPKILIISFPRLSILQSSYASTTVKSIQHNSKLIKWAESLPLPFLKLSQTWILAIPTEADRITRVETLLDLPCFLCKLS